MSKKVKHTPGPWKVDHVFKSDIYSFAPQEELLASVYPMKRAEGSWEANARLIAAAPELLEALEEIIKAWRDDETTLTSFNQLMRSKWLPITATIISKLKD